MNFLISSLFTGLILASPADLVEDALELDQYVWKNRVVLLFADKNSGELLQQQIDHLLDDNPGLEDRNLILFSIRDDKMIQEITTGRLFPMNEELKLAYWGTDQGFYAVLIGKDGGVKYESDTFIKREKLYAIIDAMPMRRAEMAGRR